ncbi:hypothetical protein OHV05_35300 (plasmid) [Kitasatospora sp. NBC_00070]|uniref:hypothetical protein n=1 Tax=Kitasatospora sp. NBC_00070 TaxID=2975962 RepID=UPI002F916E29
MGKTYATPGAFEAALNQASRSASAWASAAFAVSTPLTAPLSRRSASTRSCSASSNWYCASAAPAPAAWASCSACSARTRRGGMSRS